jgi:hypothetical protein
MRGVMQVTPPRPPVPRKRVVLAAAALWWLAGCSASSGGDGSSSSGAGTVGDSCLSAADCRLGLACVGLVCTDTRPGDGGRQDSGVLGGPGDSCLRSADCQSQLRCVMMMCSYAPDGGGESSSGGGSSGASSGGGTGSSSGNASGSQASNSSSSSTASSNTGSSGTSSGTVVTDGGPADSGADAGPAVSGCGAAEPTPRGTGGCCEGPADCISGLCIQGMCSAQCELPEHCAITATHTPFPEGTALRCAPYPVAGGRACLPGSLLPCGDGTACAPGESCALAFITDADAGVTTALRCTADRLLGAAGEAPCRKAWDCRAFNVATNACQEGLCRDACGAGVSCAAPQECGAEARARDGAGLCRGSACGAAPSGQDDLCLPGEACVPSARANGAFTPRCRPKDPSAGAPGDPCDDANPWTCQHGLCVDGACSKLCQWDGDCPSATPFCLETVVGTPTAPLTVAACVGIPISQQLCLRDGDCGRAGCQFLGGRSLFSRCTVAGTSDPADAPCGASRYCPDGRACLPDPTGTLRCALRGRTGEPCQRGDECASGLCATPEGLLEGDADASAAGQCSARCSTAWDCAATQVCRAVDRTTVESTAGTLNVRHPLCWPANDFQPCSEGAAACTASQCNATLDVCETPAGTVGQRCATAADCAAGLRCDSDGVCVREGCTPRMSGLGCGLGETCVSTGPITGVCRPACSAAGPCTNVAPGLTCQDTDGDQVPDACRGTP